MTGTYLRGVMTTISQRCVQADFGTKGRAAPGLVSCHSTVACILISMLKISFYWVLPGRRQAEGWTFLGRGLLRKRHAMYVWF